MKTTTIGTILLATTLTFAGISYAVAGNSHMNKGQQGCNNMFGESGQSMGNGAMKHRGMGFAQLDLTDVQKQEMQAIMAFSKGKNRMSDADRATRQAEMQALMYSETFDEQKAKALISQKQSKHSERKLAMLKNKHQMFQLLTDEQKTQYSELRMQHNGNKMKHYNH
ncbi:Spy/CpxP family protein refolding chaperone [Psychromonas hadalis]|uniref:Spy/CpxP family protein refolding chaperone n=1 Tax=Psychromonas hadalis TaxID=211669 RepID=UPI0003B312A9|nr:Spy/CpxP family protein refolding chaperone [Psychromonas hadalis]